MPSSGGAVSSTPGTFTAGANIIAGNVVAGQELFTSLGQITNSSDSQSLFLLPAVPGAGAGINGDYAFVFGGIAGARLYQKVAGVWTAIATV